jgi:hypothetical protein
VFPDGPLNEPVLATSWNEFRMVFGGPDPDFPFGARPSVAGAAMYQFFAGGGPMAYAVGLAVSSADELASAILAQVPAPSSSSVLDQVWGDACNLLCIPDLPFLSSAEQAPVIMAAQRFCKARLAFLIVDPPPPSAAITNAWLPGTDAVAIDNIGTSAGLARLRGWAGQLVNPDCDASAAYYPWVQVPDPFGHSAPRYVPPSGTMAGAYAYKDTSVGVWRAPAGMSVALRSVTGLADPAVNQAAGATLPGLGVNSLRSFSGVNYPWGALTLASAGADSPFRYLTTRRLTDYIQQSLRQSLRWTAFEPNGPALWSSVTDATYAFLLALWKEGALIGSGPANAFTVSCNAGTTSAADIKAGIVNLSVGIAPDRPAQFITFTIALRAGPPAGP